ncbi:hypothetical protein PC120_g5128 [Phytophthora cactorum]|nr:hypothetical protein PC120_g5128 [Phytophthora cactorum]
MSSLSPPSPSSSTSGSQQPVVDPLPPDRRGGRPQDPIWDEVLVEDGIVSCLKCEKIIHTSGKTHVERVRYHFEKKCSKRLNTPLITSVFRPAMTPAKVREFHKLFAMWFNSTGMTYNKAARHTLAAALHLLTPSDIVPTRQQLAGDLLNVCYDDFRSKMMLKIANWRCTVVTDTWTDINGKAGINYVLAFEDMTVFFESVYSGSDSHDAPYLASDIERVMAKLSFVTVAAVVTDNTATNQLVWSKLQQKHPKIFFHGCISHALHLTVKDLVQRLPWLGKLEENCRKLARFFKKNQQLCCSSAAAERNFSAHKFVQSQARNRLQDASVEKLVFLLFNAKNFDNEDMAFYEMIDVLADASEDEDSSNEDSDFEYY